MKLSGDRFVCLLGDDRIFWGTMALDIFDQCPADDLGTLNAALLSDLVKRVDNSLLFIETYLVFQVSFSVA
jgi:hypothetical protein